MVTTMDQLHLLHSWWYLPSFSTPTLKASFIPFPDQAPPHPSSFAHSNSVKLEQRNTENSSCAHRQTDLCARNERGDMPPLDEQNSSAPDRAGPRFRHHDGLCCLCWLMIWNHTATLEMVPKGVPRAGPLGKLQHCLHGNFQQIPESWNMSIISKD